MPEVAIPRRVSIGVIRPTSRAAQRDGKEPTVILIAKKLVMVKPMIEYCTVAYPSLPW